MDARQAARAAARERLVAVHKTKQNRLDALIACHPELGPRLGKQRATLADVQRALRSHEVLLDYHTYQEDAWVFVVTPDCIEPVELQGARVQSALHDFTAAVRPHDRTFSVLSEDLLNQLSTYLLGHCRVTAALVEARQVFVSPPVGRRVIPWAMLSWAPPHRSTAPERLGSAARPLGILPAARWLPLLRDRIIMPATGAPGAWIVAADGDENTPLPGSAVEANWVAAIFAPHSAGYLDPTEPGSFERLQHLDRPHAVLHVIAHGWLGHNVSGILLRDTQGQRCKVGPELLGRLLAGTIRVGILSACWSAQAARGTEWLGLATTLLTAVRAGGDRLPVANSRLRRALLLPGAVSRMDQGEPALGRRSGGRA
jgi:hypothetical protein